MNYFNLFNHFIYEKIIINKTIRIYLTFIFTTMFFSYVVIVKFYNISKIKIILANPTIFSVLTAIFLSILFFSLIVKNIKVYLLRTKTNKPFFLSIQKLVSFFNKNYIFLKKRLYLDVFTVLKTKMYININEHLNSMVSKLFTKAHLNNSFFVSKNKKLILFNIYLHYYLIFYAIPKVALASLFLYEVIFIHKVYYFYIGAPFLLLPLFYRCVQYALDEHYNTSLELLDFKFEVVDNRKKDTYNSSAFLTIKEYYEHSVKYFLTNTPNPYKDFAVTYKYLNSRTEQEKKRGDIDIPKTIQKYLPYIKFWSQIHLILWIFRRIENIYDPIINLIVYLSYFTAWSFIALNLILHYSLDPTISVFFVAIEEPFSGIIL